MMKQARRALAERDRTHFGFVDGLRALAVLGVVAYEIMRLLPPAGINASVLRAAQSAANGVALFFVVSGFALAYPVLSQLHDRRRADFDPAVYLLKRIVRIAPTYLAVVALLLLVPLAAGFYGLGSLADRTLPLDRVLHQAAFDGDGLGNDGFWTLAVTLRWYALFPFLLVLWTRVPAAFLGLALLASTADTFSAVAHGWAVGAALPFMLGIVAADALIKQFPFGRFAFAIALVAGTGAFVLEPFLQKLPGPSAVATPFPENPLWAVAFAALALSAGRAPLFEQLLSLGPLRLLGRMSFAISLTVVPAVSFAVHQLTSRPTLGIALNALALTLGCGLALWQLVDRWFEEPQLRTALGIALSTYLERCGGRAPTSRIRLSADGQPPKTIARSTLVKMKSSSQSSQSMLECAVDDSSSIVTMRSGTQSDLAAEILEARRRLAQHAAAYLAQEFASHRDALAREQAGPLEAMPLQTVPTEERDLLASALGNGVKISFRSAKRPK